MVDCCENCLDKLQFSRCPEITEIYCANNDLTNLDFAKNLNKLKFLNIEDTNISKGLEYLPKSVQEF